jgi:D-lactate dehydrogenase (cytochrome)
VTTNYVTGLEVVLADGRLVRLGGAAFDYPEYDLLALLNGSEGTLGIITSVFVRLLRYPPGVKTMMAAFDTVESAGEAVSAIIASGLVPATMEFMDRKMMRIIEDYAHPGLPVEAGAALIVEVDGYAESLSPQMDEIVDILRQHKARHLRFAQNDQERETIWYGRKSAAGAMARLSPAYYLLDGTVPRSKLAQALSEINQVCDSLGLNVAYVFHAGDGNLHPFVLIEDPSDEALLERVHQAGRRVMEICVEQDGSITGEHGVGIENRAFMPLMYNRDELGVMLEIKEVFDPRGLMNPGKVFPQVELGDKEIGEREAVAGAEGPEILEPRSSEEVVAAIRDYAAAGQRIRVRGGGTKSALLSEENCLLSTQALRGVREYTPEDLYVRVGAGTPLADLQAELERESMWVPIVSPWDEATLGGILSSNFNAPLRLRYGALRDLLLATTVVLPEGRLIRAGRPVVKNVAGYDLPKLFVGAHGTLGLLAEVTLKLSPAPRARETLLVPIEDLGRGLKLGVGLLRVCLTASALLLCPGVEVGVSAPYALIYTAEGLPEDVEAELNQVRALLQEKGVEGGHPGQVFSGSQAWADWMARAAPVDADASAPLYRIGVPPKDLPVLMTERLPGYGDADFFADLANGLLYLQGGDDMASLQQAIGKLGGYAVLLAAPVDDLALKDPWGYTPESIDLMRSLKARWDPHGLFNPGVFLV